MFPQPCALSSLSTSMLASARRTRAGRLTATLLLLAAGASAQQPLFTFLQTSDSQAGSEAEWQDFEDVLELISKAGTAGALLPRPIDLVLFPGDLTEGNDVVDWVRVRGMFDTWLTANGIPLLCTPGNRDQESSAGTAQRYEQYIASSGVWETGSASFTGHNGIAGTTGWAGLRFIGFNSSNGAWNKISDADTALIQARVAAGAAASDNVFLVTHHPHNGQSRTPLASLLTQPAIVGYVRGHSGDPKASQGLSGISNPNVWDLNTNAIVYDRDVIYYEVFQTQIRAYVIVLNDNPTQLPAPKTISLVFPLRPPLSQNVGFQGGSHSGARAWPSGFAPEKKLWFQGGNWFGVLWHESSLSWRIFRLDTFAQSWVDTGTSVSSSSTRSFDALTDGTKLYLAAHVYSVPSAPGAGSGGQVLRYSYNAAARTYALDAGFPVTINDARTESLSLAKDTIGTLWATWTAGGDVFENHSVGGDDTAWSGAALLPIASASGLDAEDVSALVAFDGKVALLWTDRIAGELACALRADGDAPTTWLFESALLAPGAVSDTLDVAASTAGRLYVTTSTPGGAVRLLRREVGLAGSGAWSLFSVADAATGLSQPIVLIDEAQQRARVFATGASSSGGSSLGGGVVYEKSAPLGTLAFASGKGTVVIQDGQNFAMGRATSTHQALSATTGLVVVASNELSQRNWHEFTSLGTAPVAPTPDFSGSPRSGNAPLLVRFSDLSSGAPTDWLWTFGDGQTSTASDVDHAYAAAGAYTVSLRASNSAGSNTLTRTAYVNVTTQSPIVTLTPVADTTSNEQNKNTNHATNSTVRVRTQSNKSFRGFLQFDLAGVTGTITSAKLRLYVSDASENGGNVYAVTSSWSESTLTWNNQPALGASLASLGSVSSGAWKELDVTSAVSGTGLVSFAISGGNTNVAAYSSREGSSSRRPQLVLTIQSPRLPPAADFSGSKSTGMAPLSVRFTDLSSGTPDAWQWDFGDGASSNQQSPEHIYTRAGSYTVSLVASNASSASTRSRSALVTVFAPTTLTQTFHPSADATVQEAQPDMHFGLEPVLSSERGSGSAFESFLQFDLAALSGTPTSARLRLFVTDESNSGGSLYLVPSSWSEVTLTWNDKPALPSTPLASAGRAPFGTWVEFDVSSAIHGPGTISFALAGGTSNGVRYASREGANPPELVVSTAIQPGAAEARNPVGDVR